MSVVSRNTCNWWFSWASLKSVGFTVTGIKPVRTFVLEAHNPCWYQIWCKSRICKGSELHSQRILDRNVPGPSSGNILSSTTLGASHGSMNGLHVSSTIRPEELDEAPSNWTEVSWALLRTNLVLNIGKQWVVGKHSAYLHPLKKESQRNWVGRRDVCPQQLAHYSALHHTEKRPTREKVLIHLSKRH